MDLRALLEAVRDGRTPIDDALKSLRDLPFENLGFARLDHHRKIRTGFPEVIYTPGKTIEQVVTIFERLAERNPNVLATRATAEAAQAVRERFPEAEYDPLGRVLSLWRDRTKRGTGRIGVVTAGTSDMPVAREAAQVARVMGNEVDELFDVGVAGLHRLVHVLPQLTTANVLIVVAGMEGALASVVGGLVAVPVIAVPTSVGYGASLGGLAALLSMLNSCASGVTVVNIDNGFGAAYAAALINRAHEA
jgi:NCAIR mutase (PurE)-related protein